jgi:Leucine-rich repeat (LRR) protein
VDFANNHLGIHNRLRNFLTLNKLPQLTTLGLYNNRLWAETIQQFTYISRFRQLTALNLSGNPIGEPGFAALTTSQQFSQLRQLQIHSDELAIENCLHARSGEQLAASNVLTQLELLDLAGHYLGDAGVKSIVESPVSQNLRSLDVSDNELGEYGTFLCEAIAKSPYLKNLRYLGLRRSQITSDSLQILLQLPQLAKGMHLDLEEIDLSTALQNQIRESPYAEQVSWTID